MSSEQEQKKLSIGFIGAGMMASAIMDALIAKDVVSSPDSITCSDVYPPTLEKAKEKGVYTTDSNAMVCERATDAIIIAVKPQYVIDVCKDIDKAGGSALVISIAAGVTLETLQTHLPDRRVVRVMPNTPCMVGQAASGFAMGKNCNHDTDKAVIKSIFGSCGLARELDEFLLNAVTGVSGSGPAYVFQFIEAMADGGVRAGLPRQVALELAAQTVKGAAEMVLQTGKHPGELKDQVCSPGGTTIAAYDALEQGAMRQTVINAVKAATRRSMQLGGVSEEDIVHKYNL